MIINTLVGWVKPTITRRNPITDSAKPPCA